MKGEEAKVGQRMSRVNGIAAAPVISGDRVAEVSRLDSVESQPCEADQLVVRHDDGEVVLGTRVVLGTLDSALDHLYGLLAGPRVERRPPGHAVVSDQSERGLDVLEAELAQPDLGAFEFDRVHATQCLLRQGS